MRSNVIAAAAFFLFAIGSAGATEGDASIPCMRLLSAVEMDAAVGPGFENVGHEEPEAGRSECIWLLDRKPDPKAVSFTFWQRGAVADADLGAFFETQARRAEAVHANKREILAGIGVAAALVPGKKPGSMAVLIVQTTQGVAYVETDYLERPQIIRVAEAIATQ